MRVTKILLKSFAVITLLAAIIVPQQSTAAGLPVFPGAEGFGAATPAGRGGAIYRVTNLNASGTGSLAACASASGPRVCIFEVSGTIVLSSNLNISNPFITIAGQTAPSPGITLRGAAIRVNTHDVLIQHLRIRVGDNPSGPFPGDRDAIQIYGSNVYNVVVDHISTSWAIDENASTSTTGVRRDITISNSVVSEALNASSHPEGPHSKGFLIGDGTKSVSMVGNLFAHDFDRNPFIKGGVEAVVVNNVFYNWAKPHATLFGSTDSTSAGRMLGSVVGNVYLRGVNTPSTAYAIRVQADAVSGTQVYHTDNRVEGVTLFQSDVSFNPLVSSPPIWTSPLTVKPASEVESSVLARAGARPADRDAVDKRIIAEVQSRTGRIIDSQSQVGGWPTLAQNSRPLTPPSNPNGDDDGDGYTNLEEWLHQFAAEVEGGAPSGGDTTAPLVSLTAPANNAVVSGTVSVSATASDNVAVMGVQFKLDGNNLGAEDTASPYALSWNTSQTSNGTHTLVAQARDAAGNTKTSSSVTVTVSNTGSTTPNPDLNSDGRVDVIDLGILLSAWGATTKPPADINQDGKVDVVDLGILLSKWG